MRFQLLDRETLPAAELHLGYALGDLVNLLLKEPFLALMADGDFFKLRVADDNGIVVAGAILAQNFLRLWVSKSFLVVTRIFAEG